MNFGTKLRTVLAIATSLNTALLATDITEFNNPTLDVVYKAASIILNFIVVACVCYFNNDYTIEGEVGTKLTRDMKANRYEANYIDEPEDSEVFEDDNE